MINLSHLNEFVLQTPFKMETVASVLLSVRERDFLASIDLKDAYFQIPVHQSSRKLLRFLSRGTVYQFKALCFGPSTAPQVFTRVFAAVTNKEKSDLVPSQTANYLGMTIDTRAARIFLFLRGARNFCQWQRCFVLCPLPRSALAGDFGTPGFTGEVGSSQSPSSALSAVAFEGALVSRVGSALPTGTILPGGEGGSVLVDGAGSSPHGG